MILAYPSTPSVWPGQALVLHVSTDQARFQVHFHRWGLALQPVGRSDWRRGELAPPGAPEDDWGWPAYVFEIPSHWPSAVYLACCVTGEADLPPAAIWMAQAAALFVVRGPGRSPLLYKLPLATWHAYNHSGGGCFYDHPPVSRDVPGEPPGARLSLRRPGGGIGGPVWGAPDHYDSSSPRQCVAHWDARFIRWLLRQGHQAEFCTDLDVHADAALCRHHRLLLSVGHDEYWSEPTRDHVEDFIAAGGNAAFFGANLCWWRIHLTEQDTAMVCHQGGPHGARDSWWPESGARRPEDQLGGLSYRHGGGWWDGPRRSAGYVVHAPEHWAYAGTGLRRGDAFGANTWPPLVGYECDGAPLEWHAAGLRQLSARAAECGTPDGFHLLASSVLGEDWQDLPPREFAAAGQGVHAACMGVFRRGGTVFSAGTTDWAQVLDSAQDPVVDLVTANVINRLLADGDAW